MRPLEWDTASSHLTPNFLAGFAIQTEHNKLENTILEFDTKWAIRLILWSGNRFINVFGGACGKNKDAIFPDDWRGRTRSRQFRLPLHVLFFRPFGGGRGMRRLACCKRAPKLVPLVSCGFLKRLGPGARVGEEEQGQYHDAVEEALHCRNPLETVVGTPCPTQPENGCFAS